MLYAEIIVRVYLDEKMLTESQQEMTQKADTDISQEHPIENGIGDLRDTIERTALQRFEYLGEGAKAIRIVVD